MAPRRRQLAVPRSHELAELVKHGGIIGLLAWQSANFPRLRRMVSSPAIDCKTKLWSSTAPRVRLPRTVRECRFFELLLVKRLS